MKIVDAIFTAGMTGFFFDDQEAIKAGARTNGFVYRGEPHTPGFTSIRQAGESISVMLLLENGQIAVGDCAAVQYSGAGGRDPLFLASTYIPFLEASIKPLLVGRELSGFREAAAMIDALQVDGTHVHTAIRYGVSQALLAAQGKAEGKLMAEVILDEYNLPAILEPVPIFAQSGDDRYGNADKMILKHTQVLPHALMNCIDRKLGRQGEKLSEYIAWLVKRIRILSHDPEYHPQLHIDVYGNAGRIFDHDPKRIANYLKTLETPAKGHELYIEGPVDMGAREAQISMMKEITDALHAAGSTVKIVADEWCNTADDIRAFTDAECCHMIQIKTPDLGSIHNVAESVIYCREHGMEAYQGGTCNETDVSTRACVHIAVACRADRMLAKPGMGFDEGYSIVKNEMERALALLRKRR